MSGIHAVYGAVYEAWVCTGCCLPGAIGPPIRRCATASWRAWPTRRANAPACRALEEDFGVQVSLEQVYRMMDLFDDDRIAD